MNQSENPSYAMPYDLITMYAKIQGAAAAAPVRAPTTFSATSSIGFMHASNNFAPTVATDITRSGVGVYTMKLRDGLPVILDIVPKVWGPNGMQVQMTDYNPTTRLASFKTFNAAGAATDVAATEFITFTIIGQKGTPAY